ncbi:hypothetical protein EIN_018830, partial [Entamoeba invadens IP1]|uniref:hypothetical protein n=1 Tax=Entamoeba invadens IP1 TaxID=370355 RepID=UPI0002C3D91B
DVFVYILQDSVESIIDVSKKDTTKIDLDKIMKKVLGEDLMFSKKQDKGMMWLNAIILTLLFLFSFGFVGYQMNKNERTQQEKKK